MKRKNLEKVLTAVTVASILAGSVTGCGFSGKASATATADTAAAPAAAQPHRVNSYSRFTAGATALV